MEVIRNPVNLLVLLPSIHFRFAVIFISTILASFDCFIIQLNFNEAIQILAIICDIICFGSAAKTYHKSKSVRSSLFLLIMNIVFFISSCLSFILHEEDLFAKVSKTVGLLRYLRYLAIFKTEIIVQFQNSLISRILYVLGIFIQCIHLLSCVWFFIACPFTRSTCLSRGESWVSHDIALHMDSDFSIWLRSMYFVLQTLATVGYGDIHVSFGMEMVFAIVLMFFGSVWNGFVISIVTTIMKSLKIASILYQQETNELSNLSKYIPEWSNNHFLSNMTDYKHHVFTKQLGVNEEQLINSLPSSLAQSIRKSTQSHFLKNHALLGIFPGLKVETLCEIATVTSYPKEMLYHLAGDSPSSIDSVREGSFSLISDSGVIDGNHLIVGDCIGQFEYFFRSVFKDTIKANSYVEVIQFSSAFLKKLLNNCNKQNLFSSEQVILSSPGGGLLLNKEKLENGDQSIEFNFDSLVSSYEAIQQRKANQLQQLNNVQQDKKKNRKLATMMDTTFEDQQSASLRSINPFEGMIWIIWNLVLIIICTFYCVRTPIKIFALDKCDAYSNWLDCLNSADFSMVLDYFCDFLFLLHIILSLTIIPVFQTGEEGYLLERDGSLIRKAYFSSYLSYLKLLVCFPWELFSVIPGVGCLWCFRAVKILSICFITPLVKEIPTLIERYHVQTMSKLQGSLSVIEQLTITLIAITWIGKSLFEFVVVV
jgi:hypothetical protein